MRKLLLLTGWLIISNITSGQSNKLPDELWQYAKAAKNKIIDNCSGWKDKDSFKVSYYSDDWSINSFTGRFKMKIKVSWQGAATGYTYYVTGYLTGDVDGCNAKFTRTDKSWSISCDEAITFPECLE